VAHGARVADSAFGFPENESHLNEFKPNHTGSVLSFAVYVQVFLSFSGVKRVVVAISHFFRIRKENQAFAV
jgi:hypothetical protein